MLNKSLKIIIFLFVLIFIPIQFTYWIWWWEEIFIFQNKDTLEYKKTYRILYRWDTDNFRDWINDFIRNYRIPNSELFNEWIVIYHKLCDRDDCKIRWKINDNMDTLSIENITKYDLNKEDYSKITTETSIYMKNLINFMLMVIFILLLVKFIGKILKFIKSKKNTLWK